MLKTCRIRWLQPVSSVVLLILTASALVRAQAHPEAELLAAVREMFLNEEGEVRYFLKWFDLNEDRTPEAIIHVVGPTVWV